jgi:hypothetical protein
MGLDAFLFESEGIALARSLGSGAWMFPYVTHEHEFQTYSQLRVDKGKYEDKTNGEILCIGGADIVYKKYMDYYEVSKQSVTTEILVLTCIKYYL